MIVCLLLADKLYLDYSSVKIYLEIQVCALTSTRGAEVLAPAASCGLGLMRLTVAVRGSGPGFPALAFPGPALGPGVSGLWSFTVPADRLGGLRGLVRVYSLGPLCRGGLTFSAGPRGRQSGEAGSSGAISSSASGSGGRSRMG
jgi:hypothetical protein